MSTQSAGTLLVLSIRAEHADRIFQGTKTVELRKKLPGASFERVYLYESGGRGIVGCFDVSKTVVKPIPELWDLVGEKAASETRFQNYFSGRLLGYAIFIENPVKFRRPLLPASLKRRATSFTAPMSYLLVRNGERLHSMLEKKRCAETEEQAVSLAPISKRLHGQYAALVTKEIAKRYDEITPGFAKAALKVHMLGHDPNGIFTTKKEVMEIRSARKRVIGFTTLTYKVGECIKTGPTILLPRYRRKAFGAATRAAIAQHASEQGVRKLYCTCPDNDLTVAAYIMRSGYSIEAHLRAQYKVDNGELVFGRLISQPGLPGTAPLRPSDDECEVVDGTKFSAAERASAVGTLLSGTGFPIDNRKAKMIAEATSTRGKKTYEDKPLQIFYLSTPRDCQGVMVLIPKRGGALKALCGFSSRHVDSVVALVRNGEKYARDHARRKIYFLHPMNDVFFIELLRSIGYQIEGLLREPYRAGVDCVVMAKLV